MNEQLERKPTLVGVYFEEQLQNPQMNQVVSYHNKEGKSRIGKITEVSDKTVKIEGRFDIPKEDIYSIGIESEGERIPLNPRWFEHLLKNKFEYKPGKQVKFFLDEEGYGIFVNKQGYKDVNYYGKYFDDFLTEIRNTTSNAEAKALLFKHNYKVVRVPNKKVQNHYITER